jgi:putative ABC transport system ATP-binding protein
MIEVARVSKAYRSGRGRVAALRELSFTVASAGNLVIMGKSGSGKTTLLHCIGGIERPDAGSITCFGASLHALSARALGDFQRHHLGIVFQHGNLISYLNVYDNIAFPLTLNNAAPKAKTLRVRELLDQIGLADAGKALPSELSGGEIQRVSFARAMAHKPKMLLADEPTASLDSETGKALTRLMFTVAAEQKCTMLIATHDPEIAASAAAILHLRDGIISGGAP